MATQQKYDAIVIGASAAAFSRLCPALAQAGWKTALIEREHVGGTRVNVGCMPTKTMVASGANPLSASQRNLLHKEIPNDAICRPPAHN